MTVKVIEVEIKKLKDLFNPISVEKAREILKSMGAEFKPVPEVELGNLRPDNIHADFYIGHFKAKRKTPDGGFVATMIGGCDPEWDIDENLVVEAMTIQESLRRYAQWIKDEYADLTDEKLLNYGCLGRKRFARARDECLRRGLISEVGE